jgi:hypothetical protein
MSGPKGPPCGFSDLGSSSRASGNVSRYLRTDCLRNISTNIFGVMKNAVGRDFDLVLRANADRYEIVDTASEVLMVNRQRMSLNVRCGPS